MAEQRIRQYRNTCGTFSYQAKLNAKMRVLWDVMSSVNAQLKQALSLIKQGDVIEAQRLLRSILRTHDDNADAWVLMAMSLSDSEKKRKALENALKIDPAHKQANKLMDQLNQSDPEDIDPRLLQAVDLIHAGKLERAAKLAAAVIHQDKMNVDAWWVMANALERDGEIMGALRNVLRLKPDHIEARKWLQELESKKLARFQEDEEPEWIARFALAEAYNQVNFNTSDAGDGGSSTSTRKKKRPNKRRLSIGSQRSIRRKMFIVVGLILTFIIIMAIGLFLSQNRDTGRSPALIEDLDAQGVQMGTIGFGQTVSGTLPDDSTVHAWTFFGEQDVTIVLETNAEIDTALTLLDADEDEVASVDNISVENHNARLEISLPTSGIYTVLIKSMLGGGVYQLVLR
ncbi:MAG: hypothetical protein D6711_15180 [Chloroflexi bacterium]|nr:MAG: hypothetical protein D6711_15180 [Chloroflexota bacterium]